MGRMAVFLLVVWVLFPAAVEAQSAMANLGSDGIVPLGGLENDVLGSVSVGIPIAPGISIDEKVSGGGGGISISFPWADVTFTNAGELNVNAVGPSVADIPNILTSALLPGSSPYLVPLVANGVFVGNPLTGFKIDGGTNLGTSSVTSPAGLR